MSPAELESMATKPMTDEEATPFDWWLLQYLKEQLFDDDPEQLREKGPDD
jgi:hypothetical protein